jgi:hypothetical protein
VYRSQGNSKDPFGVLMAGNRGLKQDSLVAAAQSSTELL